MAQVQRGFLRDCLQNQLLIPRPIADERGAFAQTKLADEFAALMKARNADTGNLLSAEYYANF